MTGNHLDVPRSLEPNPNLLSPEILTQRRGNPFAWEPKCPALSNLLRQWHIFPYKISKFRTCLRELMKMLLQLLVKLRISFFLSFNTNLC
jgi:hypothetical protein